MKHKNAVFGVIAAGVVATQGMMPIIAHAASALSVASITNHAKNISYKQQPVLSKSKEDIVFQNTKPISSNLIKNFNGTVREVLGHLYPMTFFYPQKTITLDSDDSPIVPAWHWHTNSVRLTEEFGGTVKGRKFIFLIGNLMKSEKPNSQTPVIVGGVFIEYLNNRLFLHYNTMNNPAVDLFTRDDIILGYQAGAHFEKINLMNGHYVNGYQFPKGSAEK